MSPGIPVVLGSDDEFGPVADVDVVFLPAVPDGARPAYPRAVPELIEELRLSGVTSRTWHPDAQVTFVSDRGVFADAVLQILVGVASSAGWQAICSLVAKRSGPVRVIVVYGQGGRRLRTSPFEGEAPDVARELEQHDPYRPESAA
jgi:hypothetical protein